MAKFAMKVTVTASFTYEVEVEADDEGKAEVIAERQWQDKMPEDFQVEKGYVNNWELEAEQLTADCPECGVEHVIPHDDLPVCHCSQFIADPDLVARGNLHQFCHLNVNEVCVPAPWWWQDSDYCAACGKLEEEKEQKNAV